MASPAQLTAHNPSDSPIFSPSKALRDREIARDWAYISSWLSARYHPHSVPRFERNDETLSALLALVAANAAADERAELLLSAQEEELEALDEAEKIKTPAKRMGAVNASAVSEEEESGSNVSQLADEVIEAIAGSLSPQGQEALHSITESALDLGSISTDPAIMAQDIVKFTTQNFDAKEQLRRTELLRQELEAETRRLQSDLDELQGEQRRAQEDQETVQQQIADWNRASKLLGVKFEEYRDKVAALERNSRSHMLTIDDLVKKEREVFQKRGQIRSLSRELEGYNGLPSDLASAREEYQRLNETVSRLRRKRDELFENMALG